LNLEHSALLIVVIGLIALLSAATNVIQIIVAFRRKPSADAQFADAAQNRIEHSELDAKIAVERETMHRRLNKLIDPSHTPFVLRVSYEEAEKRRVEDREEIKNDLKKLLQRTAHLAGFGEDKA